MFQRVKSIVLALSLGSSLVFVFWLVMSGIISPGEAKADPGTTPRFVTDDSGTPLAGAELRVLCYGALTGGVPVADLRVTTDANGEAVNDLPADCNFVAALHLLYEQPSGKPDHGPAYWVYATSWPPGSYTRSPVSADVLISESWTVVLFNIVASLAWEPAPSGSYLDELQQGLKEASAYLQDLTEGQMALGPVTIHTGGRHWDSADLRFLPANDFRPTAYVGGIVNTATPYNSAGMLNGTVYAPGAVYLGRFWDSSDAFDPIAGSWSTITGSRTLVHEWGHYALFLYDEYQNPAGERIYCTCDTLPDGTCTPQDRQASAMSYHYTANEFWHATVHGQPDACLKTAQWLVHGQWDWQTLASWDVIQGLPPGLDPIQMPGGLVSDSVGLLDDLFGRRPGLPAYLPMILNAGPASPSASELSLSLSFAGSALVTETVPTQVYVLDRALPGSPERILHQGQAIGQPDSSGFLGNMVLMGVDPKADSAWIHVDRYTNSAVSGGRFIYPDPRSLPPTFSDGFTGQTIADPWEASLDATYALKGSKLTTMTLVLSATQLPPESFAQLCLPDAAVGCDPGWRRPLAQIPGQMVWTSVFTPLRGMAELPPYGLVQIHAPDTGELIRWFQVSGVGPAHADADAPLRDGLVMVDTYASIPEPDECNRVIIMPAANYEALTQQLEDQPPNAEEILGLVGPPLDIDILLPTNNTCPEQVPGDHALPSPVFLTLFYSQETIDRLGINEERDLRILHYTRKPGSGFWDVVDTAGVSPELNWIASGQVNRDGIYAIGWTKR